MEIKNVPLQKIWEIRKEVMYPEFDIEAVKLVDDAVGLHFGIYINNEVVSVVSVFINNNELQFRKLATLEMEQRKGYAKMLLQHVFEIAKQNNCALIWCNARTSAFGLYQKFKMEAYGETWNADGHDFIKMKTVF